MKLIFGGAYQGKLDYALQLLTQADDAATKGGAPGTIDQSGAKGQACTTGTLVYICPDIRSCATPEECLAALDPAGEIAKAEKAAGGTAPGAPLIIDHLERMVYALIDAGRDPVEYVKKNINLLRERIIIIEDISQGVVPIDTKERAWREANGRVMAYLAGEAETVTRVFCGIPQVLKQK
jgi:adenosyl cobinamide kinase/adenosyl cobinamide phosphate guanylyltransferase